MPAISIIVTTYNIESYIQQCLDSVAAQTLSDIEVLVVDDGSSDSTPETIERYAAQDDRFVPILLAHNSPGGVATAANAGLERATAPWIGFVDGDDFIEPQMFERLHEAALTHDAELSMCQYDEVVDGSGEVKQPADHHRWDELSDRRYSLDDPDIRRQFLRFIAVPWRKLYSRELLESREIRFPVGDYFYEDNPFHWFSVLSATSIAVVPEVLCHHRVARAGQTMSTADERLMRIFAHHDTIRAFLQRHDLEATYGPTLLGWAISQLEWISRKTPAELHRTLFDRVAPILAQYDAATLTAALEEGRKGEYAQRLSRAIAMNDYRTYSRMMESKPEDGGMLSMGLYHLRVHGPVRTAMTTGRYLRQRVPGARLPRTNRSAATNDDIMFGLMVLQEHLRRLEHRIDALEESARREP